MENKIENLSKEESLKKLPILKNAATCIFFTKCSEFDIVQWLALLLL